MRTTRWTILVARALGLAAVLTLTLAPVAQAAVPSVPTIRDAWVSAVGKVTVRWDASVDASSHAIGYKIYRDTIPITAATIISRPLTPVATGITGTTSPPINAASAEATQSYTWFYAVVAYHDLPTAASSGPSGNMAPNLHGYRNDPTIVSCGRCHQVHGAYLYDYRTKELCYTCHGNTSAVTATGAKSTYNVQREFSDYTTATITGSRHRNQYMLDNKTGCTACHSSHRSSYLYDASGVYQASSSYRMMLRVKYAATSYNYYSKNSAPAANNEFCLSCHGSTVIFDGKTVNAAASIALAGGPNAFGNTGGDHNSAGYAASAHGGSTIYSNDYPATDKPGVQCEVCHDNHGSATTRLIDYRRSHTADANANKQANLCFKCHSATSTETKVAAGFVKPFAWNGRDVEAQFKLASHHPIVSSTGVGVPTEHATWSDSLKAEFDTYPSLSNVATADTAGGEIVLAQYATTITPPTRPMVYGSAGGVTTFDRYDTGGTTWDTAPANNTQFSPGAGSSAFFVNGRVYVTAGAPGGTPSAAQAVYNPATGTWAAGQTLSEAIGTGGDSTVNTRTADTAVYYSAGGGSSRLMWWNYTGLSTGEFNFQTGGTDRALGVGSAIAYAPGADRLFVIYRDALTGDGRTYYRDAPARTTVDADFTQGPQTTTSSTSNSRFARMTYFSKSGTEYLFVIGRDTSNNRDGMVISALNTTPVKTDTNVDPFGGTTLGDGCDLVWDGGDYLYAFAGGSSALYRRALIPANPVAGPWTWTPLTDSFAQATGSSIAIDPAWQPADVAGLAYRLSGSAVSTEILPYASAYQWGTVSWTESEPANTDLRVTVEGFNTATSGWDTLANQIDASSINLSTRTVAAYSKLRLTANLSTTDNQVTPWLYDWAATSVYDDFTPTTGSLTCVNCHNVHYNGRGTVGTAWQMVRAALPSNTKTNYTGTPTQFCLECHDGTPPAASTTETTVVPFAVGFSAQAGSPFFPGWDKTLAGAGWATSSHGASAIPNMTPGCDTCHDPHASNNKRLTAFTVSGPGASHYSEVRNNSTTYSEENLCYGCHTNDRTPNCSGGACHTTAVDYLNVQTAFAQTYRHPVEASGRHSDTETAAQFGPAAAARHAECADCHDPHAARTGRHTETASTPGAALLGATGIKPAAAWPANGVGVASGGWTTERLTGQTTDYEAYVCFKCHTSYSGQPFSVTRNAKTYTSTDLSLEFNPSNFSEHNVLGQSTGMESSFTFVNSADTTVTRTWALATNKATWFDTAWTFNSQMTCTSCHTNDTAAVTSARGPHGSAQEYMIDPDYTAVWRTATSANYSTLICNKCHADSWTGMNRAHAYSDHASRRCVACHIGIPHGWKRPRMLGYTSDPAAMRSTNLLAVQDRNITSPTDWDDPNCATTGCDTHPTSLSGYTYWP